jgi:integrase
MKTHRTRLADPTKILMRRELAAVLAELTRKAKRSPSMRLNLVIFRLATCCGLRASEIAKLQIGDVRTEATRPQIRIRNGAAKGGRPRMVPLWWDAGTLEDLRAWKAERLDASANTMPSSWPHCMTTNRSRGIRCGSATARRAGCLGRSGWRR